MPGENQAYTPKPHGREIVYLVDEGFYTIQGKVGNVQSVLNSFKVSSSVNILNHSSELTHFRFGRMFGLIKTASIDNIDDALKALGEAMIQMKGFKENSSTPAGYTFLAQFIAHDMSFDNERLTIPLGEVEEVHLISKRSPTLELDSLFGRYFASEGKGVFDSNLYKDDKVHFKIDLTLEDIKNEDAKYGLPNDLPRKNKIAVIADERNDENLVLAQTHVAFLRFHNAVVDFLIKKNWTTDTLFETAREIVIKHYQWIILHDFLPQIIDTSILNEVIDWAKTKNPKLDWLRDEEKPYIPVEFSAAAFRLGHSTLQDSYEWNRIFQSPNTTGSFEKLFQFTGTGKLDGFDNLLGSWAIDWSRFFDFTKYDIPPITEKFNRSRKIDPYLVFNLKFIPEFVLLKVAKHLQNLAIRNLLRGRYLVIPSGQDVVKSLGGKLKDKVLLTTDQIVDGPHKEILEKYFLDKNTPLWYYILKEAEIIGEGNRLGAVGSYIVAETFVKLIQQSKISIFNDNWNPQHEPLINPNILPEGFGMVDLIKFADSEDKPLINPLGN